MAKSGVSTAPTRTQNRREWPRYAAEKSFALAANVDGKVLLCTVADVSLGGAKLIFDSEPPKLSSSGDATVELNHPDSGPVHCATVWQSAKEIGIEFDFSEDSLGLISICIRNMVDLERHPEALAG
ncbi:PilZ domain-containing protein [Pelagibius marinus]|uniref:PilZ domain-containing protein n=1 Tax=Pelagibius marinus TaxID=2762760 RepID=UPI00187229D5|nr:PilZ domain-containing protein [Pelagibius marinus]